MKKELNLTVVERLLVTLRLMADKCGVNTLDLAARLEASPKTIARDRDFIRDRLQIELEYTIFGDKAVFRAKDPSMIPALCKFLARFR